MTTVLGTEAIDRQAASNGRFFDPVDPWVLEKARALPAVKAASEAAARSLRETSDDELKAWKGDHVAHPDIDQLVLESNTYGDVGSLVSRAGQTAVRGIMQRPPVMETIGRHTYWTTWLGERSVLCATDETGDPIIYFDADLRAKADPDNGVRFATPDDYAALLVDIAEQVDRTTAA